MHQMHQLAGFASFGIDVGHSSVKVAAAMLDRPTLRHVATIPTVVIPAIDMPDDETARRVALNTVMIDGAAYIFGDSAIAQGMPAGFSGESRDWIATHVHDVLIVGAWQRAMSMIDCRPQVIHLALGLPSAFFKTQKDALKLRVTELLRAYLAPGQQLVILVQPQAAVPLKNLQHLPDGLPDLVYREAFDSWAVIDIGHFTTDFSILLKTEFQAVGGDSIGGASKVYSAVRAEFNSRGYSDELASVDEAIKTGQVLHYGKHIDVSDIIDAAVQPLRSAIINRAQTLLGSAAKRLNGVIVSGGIAPLVIDSIQGVFPNAVLDSNPSMSIAEGLCRFGLYAHHMWAEKYRAAA
jgi:plasmid segregation protein ParM